MQSWQGFNGGSLIERGTEMPYLCVRDESSEVGTVDFQKIWESLKGISSNGQPSNTNLSIENGGPHNRTFWAWQKRFLR